MTVRTKTLLLIGVTLITLVLASYLAASRVLMDNNTRLEQINARQSAERAVSTYQASAGQLEGIAADWANSGEVLALARDQEGVLSDATLRAMNLDLLALLDADGKVVLGRGFRIDGAVDNRLPAELAAWMSANAPGLLHSAPARPVTGVVTLPDGIMLVAVTAAGDTGSQTGGSGVFVLGKDLNSVLAGSLGTETAGRLALYPLTTTSIPTDIQGASADLSAGGTVIVRSLSGGGMAGYSLFKDLNGKPAAILRLEISQDIYQQGQTSLRYLLGALAVISLAFLVASLFASEKILVSRITRLSGQIRRISTHVDLSQRLNVGGNDELSGLGGAIDRMLDELQQTQQKQAESEERYRAVVEQSHDGLAILDTQTLRILEANSALQNLLGVYRPHIFELSLFDLTTRSEKLQADLDHLVEGGAPLVVENRLKRAFGEYVDVEVSISVVAYHQEKALYVVVRDITERKQASRELQLQRDFAVQVMSAMGQGLAVTDAEGCFDFINPALARMVAYPADALQGRSLADLTHPEEQAAFAEVQAGWSAGNVVIREMRLVRGDGASLYTLVTAAPRRREGKVSGAILVVTDLTERRRVEENLQKSETRYRTVVESVNEVIFQTGVTGRWVFLNPAWTEITGFALEDSIGVELLEFVDPQDRGHFREELQAVLDGKQEGCQAEVRFRTAKNGSRWMDVSVRPQVGANGEVLGVSGTLTDVTERRLAEDALRRGEEFIRGLYEVASSRELDFTHKIQALLVMGCHHFGLDTGALARLDGETYEIMESFSCENHWPKGARIPAGELYTPEGQSDLSVCIEHAGDSPWADSAGYQAHRVEAYMGTPVVAQGEIYGILNFSSLQPRHQPFTNSNKEFLRLMAQWIGAEVESEQFTGQLQLYAGEIARKNQTLSEARDRALESSRMKSEFLATMSHEIRTPMNSVLGMTELLLGTGLSKEQREYSTIVHESAKLLLTLINDILDFSKIEAGRLELEEIEFNLTDIVEGSIELFASQAEKKQLALTAFVDPGIPERLVGDPTRLRQILFNLAGNAVKFTANGDVSVKVDAVEGDAERITLRFKVKDSGIGLSDEARRRLFQPFTQAERGTTRKYGGTGLGLAIAKHLVELMEGEIGVESQPGQGSLFWFTIKAGVATQAAPARTLRKGVRVLVADASSARREALMRYLAGWGATPGGAATIDEALESIRQAEKAKKPFRVLLADQDTSDLDLHALAEEVRTIDPHGRLRLALITGFDDQAYGDRALEEGFSAAISRPVRKARLKEVIYRLASGPKDNGKAAGWDHMAAQGKAKKPATKVGSDSALQTILLAEDNPANQKLAVAQLQKLGYAVDVVSDGRQAVEALIEVPGRYSLVLMDCQMPEMDGFTATQVIRQFEAGGQEHIPIIAMTASALEEDRDVCLAMGMDDYISKPVSLDELMRALSRWLGTPAKAAPSVTAGETELVQAEPALDPGVLDEIRGLQSPGESDFLLHIIDTYLRESGKLMEAIRQAQVENDGPGLQRGAHTLKGSSANLGARRLSGEAAALETAARDGRMEEASSLVERVEEEYRRVVEALEAQKRAGEKANA